MSGFRIRSITAGMGFDNLDPVSWDTMGKLFDRADVLFGACDIPVQTRRVVLEPLSAKNNFSIDILFSVLDSIERNIHKYKVRWVCLPILLGEEWVERDFLPHAVKLLQKYPFLFLHFLVTDKQTIRLPNLLPVAKAIKRISVASNNGFDNFRVGVGANICPNTPFFPFSLHHGVPAFSIAIESLQSIMQVARRLGMANLEQYRADISAVLTNLCTQTNAIGIALENELNMSYRGLDASLAPFPSQDRSVAFLLETCAPIRWGGLGTTSATAFFTRLLKSTLAETDVRTVGFNGVMYSPLEDIGLAERVVESPMLAEHFMLYSTTCGCGVDMVPLDGDTLPEEIATLIQDVATLALVHNKPLGVRILPIPHRHVNEITAFNHDFLVNTRIMQLKGQGVLFNGERDYTLEK